MTAVVSRDRELAAAEEFLARARGAPAVLVLEGDAGIGKTTVWREVIRRAEAGGFGILSCRPAEQETKLSLSAVADLLEATPAAVFDALPTPQRHALEIALLRREPGDAPSDARTLATALRSVLTSLADERPLLVAIDDVQWLDRGSAAALGFALRRMGATHCGWLLARRSGERAAPMLEDAVPEAHARIDIGPLTLGALHHVVGTRQGRFLPRPLLRRVHDVSGGNPFFALEIARQLPDLGGSTPDAPLPVPRDVAELVRRRVAAMPTSTREMFLVAAAAASPSRTLVDRVLQTPLGDCFDHAERAGFAALEGDAVVFAHPLYAAAIYEAASPAERRDVHRRLADAVDESEERARHVALSVETVDDAAAATVQSAARAAFLRGSPSTAAELAELALRVAATRGPQDADRIVDRAYYLYCAGEPAQARDVLRDIDDWAGWPTSLEARARGLLLELVLVTDGATAAVDLGERMLTQSLPGEARARVLVHLSNAYEFDAERAFARGEEAMRLLDELGDVADPGTWARALCWRVRNRLGLGFGIDPTDIERALAFEAQLPRERWVGERVSYRFGIWLRHVDQLDESRSRLERSLEEALETADELLELTLRVHLGLTECYAGNLLLARERMEQASELGRELDIRPVGLLAARAVVEAHLGEEAAVRSLASDVLSDNAAEQGGPATIQASLALGLLELSLGNAHAADASLVAALSGVELAGQREPGVFRVHGHAAEAALVAGEPERAAQIAALLIQHGERIGHGWSLAVGTRVSALVAASRGDLDEALERAERSRQLHDALPMPFERALAMLAQGTIERRSRLRTRAKASLEGAIDLFDAIDARAWAARARAELDRVGLRRKVAGADGLTPSEARVAGVAARGVTTREIASELFMSPKTVEANLTRIYRKLGVRSRAALATKLVELAAEGKTLQP